MRNFLGSFQRKEKAQDESFEAREDEVNVNIALCARSVAGLKHVRIHSNNFYFCFFSSSEVNISDFNFKFYQSVSSSTISPWSRNVSSPAAPSELSSSDSCFFPFF